MERGEDAAGEPDTALADAYGQCLLVLQRGEAENSVLAARFQQAINESNAEEFGALCVIAGGKPDIIADISACSFCEDDGECLVSAVDEYADIARHADTAVHLNINTFTADMPVVSVAAKPSLAAWSAVSSGEEWTGQPDSHHFMPPPVTRTFADFIGSTGFTAEAPDPGKMIPQE
ncbi:hypothetical protein CYMTET_20535 [Cymbomonas tetramitiformis]|uniref:Uncharacterized protein n=1 Tax=Cymbomonas tetramitiformis TaxID=36881 RepID=A0AAE0G4J5_9CHLO|nr:hypothetical protein CYMTET_20535 [Cymbomonas tetramitiformis]